MSLVQCKTCGEMISDQATTCPKCGASTGFKTLSETASKVDLFIAIHGKEFPEFQLPFIREKLMSLSPEKISQLNMIQFTNPVMVLIISIFFGELGIDRFIIGHTGAGIGKLLTCGGCGIWWLIDLFVIMDKTKEHNLLKLKLLI